jgi:hypothetical protein
MSRHWLNAFITSKQLTKPIISHTTSTTYEPPIIHSNCELNSHANTCVAGPHCIILEWTDQVTNVSAYSDQSKVLQDIPIITAATAYDDPQTGITYIIVIRQ